MRRNGDGSYYLHDLSGDEAAAAYVNEVAAQEDVTELYAQVNEEYAARLSQDEVLAAYLESYQNDMVVAVGEALEEQTTEAETARRRLRARKARPRRRTDRKRRTGIPEMRKAPAPHPSRTAETLHRQRYPQHPKRRKRDLRQDRDLLSGGIPGDPHESRRTAGPGYAIRGRPDISDRTVLR